MAEPTPVVRAVTYERDSHRCVSCGATSNLQYQHRQATGMGGSKVRPHFVEGVTSCAFCNEAYEHTLQMVALKYGWKVRSWVADCASVPVYFIKERTWFRLTREGTRVRLSRAEAMRMMHEVYGVQYDEEKGLVA